MKVKYNKGGKSPVDPPKSRPDSDATYSLGGNYFYGQEADRLGAFSQYLAEKYPALDGDELNNQQLRIEEMERFINSGAYKSDDAMRAYEVDPSNFAPGRKSNLLGEESSKPKSVMDEFESAFGSSPFGGSDPFEDDPDIQRMREEAAARDKKKGKRKRFEQGGKVNDMKVKYGKGGSAKEMYATGGMLKALLADPKQAAMAREILAEMGAKIPEYEEGGATGDPEKEGKGKMIKGDPGELRTQDLTSQEQKFLGLLDDREMRGKYENFYNMNMYSATPAEAFKFYQVNAAMKLLKDKAGITVQGSTSPDKVLEMARTKDVLQEANAMAKEYYADWGDDRRKNPIAYQASRAGVGGATRKKDGDGNLIMLQ